MGAALRIWAAGGAEHAERMQGQQLVRPGAPVDNLDVAALRARRLPPAAAGTPAAVREPSLLEQVDTVSCARVVREPHAGEHDQRLEEVVVPVRRRVRRHERLTDRLTADERPEESVLEEELGGAPGGGPRPPLPRPPPKL